MIVGLFFMALSTSFRTKEYPALRERNEQVAKTVLILRAGVKDSFYLVTVAESDRHPCRVEGKLMQKVACKLVRIGGQQLFEFVYVIKAAAIG
jgi:hypothetical protein